MNDIYLINVLSYEYIQLFLYIHREFKYVTECCEYLLNNHNILWKAFFTHSGMSIPNIIYWIDSEEHDSTSLPLISETLNKFQY